MVGSLYHSNKLSSPAILYLYKSQIIITVKFELEFLSPYLPFLKSVQKYLRSLVGSELFSTLQFLPDRRNDAKLSLFPRQVL